jgi:hypothetical protein
VPQYKREPLDLVEIIHAEFPEWPWLEIAQWMDGTRLPSPVQQVRLQQWEQGLSEPCQPSLRTEFIPDGFHLVHLQQGM